MTLCNRFYVLWPLPRRKLKICFICHYQLWCLSRLFFPYSFSENGLFDLLPYPVPMQPTSPQPAGFENHEAIFNSSVWSCSYMYACLLPQRVQCLFLAVVYPSLPHSLSPFAGCLNLVECAVAVCDTHLGGPPQTEPSSVLLMLLHSLSACALQIFIERQSKVLQESTTTVYVFWLSYSWSPCELRVDLSVLPTM